MLWRGMRHWWEIKARAFQSHFVSLVSIVVLFRSLIIVCRPFFLVGVFFWGVVWVLVYGFRVRESRFFAFGCWVIGRPYFYVLGA